MKFLISMLSVGLLLLLPAGAVEPAKPQLTLTVKRQLLDSDHEMRGKLGNTKSKTLTLRVEIVNTTSATVAASELSGDALVTRAVGEHEKLVRETLAAVKVPEIKPNQKITLDLGKIKLSELEWRNRKFEETLEEWKVTCKQGQTELGSSLSSDRFETLDRQVAADAPKPKGPGGPAAPVRRKIRGLGE